MCSLSLVQVIYGAPAHIPAFSLPSACTAYSNTDGNGISLTAVNVTGGAAQYNPTAPAPYAGYSSSTARCSKGPCVDLCCHTNATGLCVDNLVSGGGHYLPSRSPVYEYFVLQFLVSLKAGHGH